MVFQKVSFTLFALFLFFLGAVYAQDDAVLFTVDGDPVTVSEFDYIYSKTNGEEADYSKKSVESYLDLYVKFKLKVKKAKELKVDTIPSLNRELDGYRNQLSNSYLIDKEVKDKLLREAYERKKTDVNISHILISITGRFPADTLVSYNRAKEALAELNKGNISFEEAAKRFSTDAYSKNNGGKIGYINALLPNGFYQMESAAYNTPVGKYSGIVRTSLGYHIIKVNETRPARGLIEAAHIVIRKEKNDKAKETIQKVYDELEAGASFESLVARYSEDTRTNKTKGNLGIFGIGAYEPSFEDAAFDLKSDGDYTQPIETQTGWHIIKRISKPTLEVYEVEKNRLLPQVERDERFTKAREAMIQKIREENNLVINQATYLAFVNSLDNSFTTYKWEVPAPSSKTLITFNNERKYTLGNYTDYLAKNARNRASKTNNTTTPKEVADRLLEDFIDQMALDYEKTQLTKKYPDYRNLMREYEEGIILFETTKMLVWDKASKDSIGLQNFYDNNKSNYKWGKRASISTYTLNSTSPKLVKDVRKCAKRKSPDKVLEYYNKKGDLLSVENNVVEKGKSRNEELESLTWKKKTMTSTTINKDNSVSFTKIEEILPDKLKSLSEARGYVIADYQDYLENQWVEELRKEYKVVINQKVLDSLIK